MLHVKFYKIKNYSIIKIINRQRSINDFQPYPSKTKIENWLVTNVAYISITVNCIYVGIYYYICNRMLFEYICNFIKVFRVAIACIVY